MVEAFFFCGFGESQPSSASKHHKSRLSDADVLGDGVGEFDMNTTGPNAPATSSSSGTAAATTPSTGT
jgi:hypothetical protein